jgi:hypothetical protein
MAGIVSELLQFLNFLLFSSKLGIILSHIYPFLMEGGNPSEDVFSIIHVLPVHLIFIQFAVFAQLIINLNDPLTPFLILLSQVVVLLDSLGMQAEDAQVVRLLQVVQQQDDYVPLWVSESGEELALVGQHLVYLPE